MKKSCSLSLSKFINRYSRLQYWDDRVEFVQKYGYIKFDGLYYRLVINEKAVIVSCDNFPLSERTYIGRAKLHPTDQFDITKGVHTAIARCIEKYYTRVNKTVLRDLRRNQAYYQDLTRRYLIQ